MERPEMSMERRLLLAMVLAVGVLVLWNLFFPAPVPPPQEQPQTSDAGVAAVDAQAESGLSPEPPPIGTGEPGEAAPTGMEPGEAGGQYGPAVGEEAARVVTLETDSALVMVSNRGGRVMSWKLKTYKDSEGRNLELIPESARAADILPLSLLLQDQALEEAANSAIYKMDREGSGGDSATVSFIWADGAGAEVRKTLTVGPGFSADVQVSVSRGGVALPASITWGAGFGEEVPTGRAAAFSYDGRAMLAEQPRPRRIAPPSLEEGEVVGGPGRAWGGMEDTYFAVIMLPGGGGGDFRVRRIELPAGGGEEPRPALQVALALAPASGVDLYVGPKSYRELSAMGRGLQEVVHFQSGIWVIGPVVTLLTRGLFHALIFLHERVVANWGWAIVILTGFIKLVFWPVTQKAMLSMKRMQEKTKRVQPKVAALKEKYRRQGKKDIESRQQMNQEVMALYQKEGINPLGNLGGCLPLLLQLPILYGFYNLLQVAIELRQAPWLLWIHDLSVMDPFYVLPVIMGASMVAQQVLTGAAIPDPAQRRMMYLTPVLFTLFFLNLPAGLVLYWLVNNMLGILQQGLINRRYALETVAATASGRQAR